MRSLWIYLAVFFMSAPAHGFFSLMDTGDLVKEGDYRILGETQVLFDEPKGLNINGRFATGVRDDSEIQFEVGLGSIDYYLGAFWKYVPFPDTDSQPAIGVRGGLTFANVNDNSTYGLNITPMISKMFEVSFGKLSPYSGLQLGLQKNVDDSYFGVSLAIGVEWRPNQWDFSTLKDFHFLAEVGFEIDDAFDYISLGASYNF